MKKLIFIFLAVLAAHTLGAAEKSKSEATQVTKITGRITDKNTGEALAGVEIHLMDTKLKVYTDFEGNFEIKDVQPGAHALKVQYISYQPQVENVYADASGSNKVSLKLKSVVE